MKCFVCEQPLLVLAHLEGLILWIVFYFWTHVNNFKICHSLRWYTWFLLHPDFIFWAFLYTDGNETFLCDRQIMGDPMAQIFKKAKCSFKILCILDMLMPGMSPSHGMSHDYLTVSMWYGMNGFQHNNLFWMTYFKLVLEQTTVMIELIY